MYRPTYILYWFVGLFILPQTLNAQFNRSSTTRAVIIGISDYQSDDIPDLEYAHKDAQAFYDYLRSAAGGNVTEEHIRLLINGDATGGNVHKALYWLVRESEKNDKCIIYFSGHGDVENDYGDQQGHFLVFDSPAEIYQINSIRMGDLQRIVQTLSSVKESQVIIFSDACRSGQLAGSKVNGAQATAAAMNQQFANEVKIMSCQPDEFSVEGSQWGGGRGLFSYVLLDGMRGLADENGDLQVTLRELENYLYSGVRNLAPEVRQTPVALGNKAVRMSLIDPKILDSIQIDKGMEQSEPVAQNDSNVKSNTPDPIKLFYSSVAQGTLLTSDGNSSAEYYYEQIKADTDLKDQEVLVRGDFISALQDEAQGSINRYLATDPEVLEERWKGYSASYFVYADYLRKAAALMGAYHYLYPQMKAKSIYFNAVAQRLEWDREGRAAHVYTPLLDSLTNALIMDPQSSFINNELGLVYERMGELEKARKQYEFASKLSPTWAMPYFNLGIIYRKIGDYEKALQFSKDSERHKSDFKSALLNTIRTKLEMDELSGALQDIRTYQSKYGIDENLLYEKAAYQIRMGEDASVVISTYDSALVLNQSKYMPWKGKGHVLVSSKQYDSAILSFKRWVAIQPNNPVAHSDLGTAYFKKKDWGNAVISYKKMLELDPNNSFRVFLASAQMNMANWVEAEGNLKYVLSNVDPEDAWSFFDLAGCYAQMGDTVESINSLKKAIELGFNQKDLIEQSEYLSPIRSFPEYQELVKKL